jgi:hypothetical protein
VALPVEQHRPTDHRGVAAEAALPERVAQHHHLVAAGLVLALEECAAQQRSHAEHFEIPRRGPCRDEPLGLPHAGEVRVPLLTGGKRGEDAQALAYVAIRGRREGRFLRSLAVDVVDGDQPVWREVRQRPQQHPVDDREERGVGADAEREGGDHDQGEAGVVQQPAERVAEVASHGLVPFGAGNLALGARDRPSLVPGMSGR